MAINKIAMLGAGTMGQGIAWALAAAGKKVVLFDIKQEFIDRAINAISKSLVKAEEKGKAAPGTKDAVIGNISGTVVFEELKDVDFVIEGVFENMAVKKDIYTKLDALLA
ncbi:MAG: 3-hydroxyacyl-CoA dehydrogenase NAD-binding domain-containing protein, partial [Syntrophomonas sp.]|nr:3-hydroxyacyl-CoA dehydrogenase NAD-binding domain-containing protein [Syntrophomonas sp.]